LTPSGLASTPRKSAPSAAGRRVALLVVVVVVAVAVVVGVRVRGARRLWRAS
jgi:hypothetical protein